MFWRENRLAFFSVLAFIAVMCATFYLRHVPLEILWSALLFGMTILILFVLYRYYQFRRRHAERVRQLVPEVDLKAESLAEADMLRLLAEQKDFYEAKLARITQFDEELTDVVSIWSHQMKVPLSVLDLMGQTGDFTTDDIKEQTFQLENYLDLLLNHLRLNHQQTDYRFTKVPLKALLQRVVRKFAPVFIRKNLRVQIDGDAVWTTDEKWLALVLEQIISNSVKYTKSGGVVITIRPDAIQIQDTGIGILKEDLPRLFDHGFTGYNGRRFQKATGLGFFLVKEVADHLSLTVHVDSQINQGTVVTIGQKKAS
ncbi:MAG: sensor histidine kinase [Oenococcus sp.]|uniref:sensor histidine kinase n=1 Tax=Oenococcus sp. TaxID=1979414 RepID=UPI0039EA80CB